MTAINKLCRIFNNSDSTKNQRLVNEYFEAIHVEIYPKLLSLAKKNLHNQADAEDIVQQILLKALEETKSSVFIENNEDYIKISKFNLTKDPFFRQLESSHAIFNKPVFKDWVEKLHDNIEESLEFIQACANENLQYLKTNIKGGINDQDIWSKEAENRNRDFIEHRDKGKALLEQLNRVKDSFDQPDETVSELVACFEELTNIAAAVKIPVPGLLFSRLSYATKAYYSEATENIKKFDSLDGSHASENSDKNPELQVTKTADGRIVSIKGIENDAHDRSKETIAFEFEGLNSNIDILTLLEKLFKAISIPVKKAKAELGSAKSNTEISVATAKYERQLKIHQWTYEYICILFGIKKIDKDQSDTGHLSRHKISKYLSDTLGEEITEEHVRGIDKQLNVLIAKLYH